MAVSQFLKSWYVSSLIKIAVLPAVDLRPHLEGLSCLLQMVRSTISWAVTDALGRAQHITPLYGSRKRYPILALRGIMGAIAMALYYEAFERLMLSEAVSAFISLGWMLQCILTQLPSLSCYGFHNIMACRKPNCPWHTAHVW